MVSLEGRTLVWMSWDESGVFTAATRHMLIDILDRKVNPAESPIKLQLIRANSLDDVTQTVQRQPTSLVTIVVHQHAEIAVACKAFAKIRGRIDQPICVVYIRCELLENVGLLLEAGAQVVVSQLPSWQRVLPRVLARVPLSKQGFHPLTTGLVDRLPWPGVR